MPNREINVTFVNVFVVSAASPLMSVHCSPSPTRRISNISLIPSDFSSEQKESLSNNKKTQKTLPIINPLVRLPQWPSKYFKIIYNNDFDVL